MGINPTVPNPAAGLTPRMPRIEDHGTHFRIGGLRGFSALKTHLQPHVRRALEQHPATVRMPSAAPPTPSGLATGGKVVEHHADGGTEGDQQNESVDTTPVFADTPPDPEAARIHQDAELQRQQLAQEQQRRRDQPSWPIGAALKVATNPTAAYRMFTGKQPDIDQQAAVDKAVESDAMTPRAGFGDLHAADDAAAQQAAEKVRPPTPDSQLAPLPSETADEVARAKRDIVHQERMVGGTRNEGDISDKEALDYITSASGDVAGSKAPPSVESAPNQSENIMSPGAGTTPVAPPSPATAPTSPVAGKKTGPGKPAIPTAPTKEMQQAQLANDHIAALERDLKTRVETGQITQEEADKQLATALTASPNEAHQTRGRILGDVAAKMEAQKVVDAADAAKAGDLVAVRQKVDDAAKDDRAALNERLAKMDQMFRSASERVKAIDPNSWWSSRHPLQKALAFLGAAASGFGAGLVHQQSSFVPAIMGMIDTDIRSQQANNSNSLALMKTAMEYGEHASTAFNMQRLGMLDTLANRLEMAAQSNLPLQQAAQYKMMAAQLRSAGSAIYDKVREEVTADHDAKNKPIHDALQNDLAKAEALAHRASATHSYAAAKLANAEATEHTNKATAAKPVTLGTLQRNGPLGGFQIPPEQFDALDPKTKAIMVKLPSGEYAPDISSASAAKKNEFLQSAAQLRDWVSQVKAFQNKYKDSLAGPRTGWQTNAAAEADDLEARGYRLANELAKNSVRFSEADVKHVVAPQVANPGAWDQGQVNAKLAGVLDDVNGRTAAVVGTLPGINKDRANTFLRAQSGLVEKTPQQIAAGQ